jgi:hypothetical protein
MLELIPEDVRKQLSNAELNDRLVEAARLGAQATDPRLNPDLRKAAKIRSQAVLKAQPRATTERLHREMIAKAAAMPAGFQANMIREHARQLLEDHPTAPSTGERAAAVRKAKAAEEPIPVFDADGNLVGICDAADITPVAGQKATPAAPAAMAGDPVTKGQRLSVWDGFGQRYVTTRARIRKTDRPRRGVYDDGPLERLLGGHDTGYGTGGVAPEVQARNRGPVGAGGTTGLGMPRRTGPAASLPADGPQAALPGDVAERAVIKALGPEWTEFRDWTGALAGAVRRSSITRVLPPGRVAKSAMEKTHANVYDAARRKVGMAPLSDIVPLANLRAAARTGDPRRRAGG